jgi:cell division septation protein DedD
MASGGRRTAGERVLESKHVIGLFLLMLLFSGVFFTLGYVMGRNQYDGQVRAAVSGMSKPDSFVAPKAEPQPKKSLEPEPGPAESDPATSASNSPDWEFYRSSKPASAEPHLEPPAKAHPSGPPPSKTVNAKVKVDTRQAQPPVPVKSSSKPSNAPIPSGSYVLQVAALLRQDDAVTIANSLQRKHYLAYVQMPAKDKYYRVQVGPFKDQKTADISKKGLEGEGFKAFYVKH